MIIGDPARRRREGIRALGVDAAFDRVAAQLDVGLAIAERGAGGDAELLAHEVEAADHLGDRVLDLQARVHLDEKEFAVLIEEFEGAHTLVAELAQCLDGQRAEPVALFRVERRRGRFFEHLLMRALQRAVALPQMDDATLAVAEDLDLDVAGPLEMAFEIDLRAAEERGRLVLRYRQHPGELGAVAGHLHAAAAAARAGLDQDGIADRAGGGFGRCEIADAARARDGRDPELADGLFCRHLVPHQPDVLGRRTDKGEPVVRDRGGEVGVFGQKAEPGMDRVGAGDRRRGEDRRHVQIAVARRRWADADGLVSQPDMHRGARRPSNGPRPS